MFQEVIWDRETVAKTMAKKKKKERMKEKSPVDLCLYWWNILYVYDIFSKHYVNGSECYLCHKCGNFQNSISIAANVTTNTM